MKNKITLALLGFSTISCKSQIISLEQAVTYKQQTGTVPQNTTYIKDMNHSLDKYIGTWKGYYNGYSFEFKFTKKENVNGYDVNWDFLIGRMQVTDFNENITYNTFNELDDTKTKLSGYNFQPDLKAYMMYFVGNSNVNCNEQGYIYLRIKPETPDKMSILMLQDNDISIEGACPPNFKPTIPYKTSISLTRQ